MLKLDKFILVKKFKTSFYIFSEKKMYQFVTNKKRLLN